LLSEVDWLSLCVAPLRIFFKVPRSLVVLVEESANERLVPQDRKSSCLGFCCGAGLRASVWRPRRRRGRNSSRFAANQSLSRRVHSPYAPSATCSCEGAPDPPLWGSAASYLFWDIREVETPSSSTVSWPGSRAQLAAQLVD
jgi:hypothetical protein